MAELIKNISTKNNRYIQTAASVFGEIVYHPKGECGPRVQGDYQLVIVHSGSATVHVEKVPREIPSGSVGLMLPGLREHFFFSRTQPTHHSWCAIDIAGVPARLRTELAKAPSVLPLSEVFAQLLETAFKLEEPDHAEEVLNQLALLLFEEYIRMGCLPKTLTSDRPWNRARRYLHRHYMEPEVLNLAAKVGAISVQHLRREFQTHLGLSPSEYLWRLRVENGIVLLNATSLSVSEIADRCGFKNPFHFSRIVKAQTGLSPKEFRNKN